MKVHGQHKLDKLEKKLEKAEDKGKDHKAEKLQSKIDKLKNKINDNDETNDSGSEEASSFTYDSNYNVTKTKLSGSAQKVSESFEKTLTDLIDASGGFDEIHSIDTAYLSQSNGISQEAKQFVMNNGDVITANSNTIRVNYMDPHKQDQAIEYSYDDELTNNSNGANGTPDDIHSRIDKEIIAPLGFSVGLEDPETININLSEETDPIASADKYKSKIDDMIQASGGPESIVSSIYKYEDGVAFKEITMANGDIIKTDSAGKRITVDYANANQKDKVFQYNPSDDDAFNEKRYEKLVFNR